MGREKRTITTEFKNNGVFRYFLKTMGFRLIKQEDANFMYFVDNFGVQVLLKYAPSKTITLIDNRGNTIFRGETCTKQDIEALRTHNKKQNLKALQINNKN